MKKPHRKSNARLTDNANLTTDEAHGPVRQCCVTRERLAQTELVRFALSPGNQVTPDIAGRLPGRGVWVKADRDTIRAAAAKGAFGRQFKSQVSVPDGLDAQVEDLLVKRCIGLIGLAKKAGEIVIGIDQVRAALRKARPGLLLEAADGAEDGRTKVYFLAKALYSDVKVVGALSSTELGMAFGRERVIHGLVRSGPVARSLSDAYARLKGFRYMPELDWFADQDR